MRTRTYSIRLLGDWWPSAGSDDWRELVEYAPRMGGDDPDLARNAIEAVTSGSPGVVKLNVFGGGFLMVSIRRTDPHGQASMTMGSDNTPGSRHHLFPVSSFEDVRRLISSALDDEQQERRLIDAAEPGDEEGSVIPDDPNTFGLMILDGFADPAEIRPILAVAGELADTRVFGHLLHRMADLCMEAVPGFIDPRPREFVRSLGQVATKEDLARADDPIHRLLWEYQEEPVPEAEARRLLKIFPVLQLLVAAIDLHLRDWTIPLAYHQAFRQMLADLARWAFHASLEHGVRSRGWFSSHKGFIRWIAASIRSDAAREWTPAPR